MICSSGNNGSNGIFRGIISIVYKWYDGLCIILKKTFTEDLKPWLHFSASFLVNNFMNKKEKMLFYEKLGCPWPLNVDAISAYV